MYAIVRTGGKQYRVTANDVITVEKLPGEAGGLVKFGEVLMIGGDKETTLGAPLLEGALVTATILEQARADKILVFKKKRRQNYRRLHGHRQEGTVLRIDEVLLPGATPKPRAKPQAKKAEAAPAKKAEAKTAKPAEKPAAEKPAAKKAAAPAKTPAAKAAPKKPAAKKPAATKK